MYVFQFGFESPSQRAANTARGWDDESSGWVIINASDEASAIAWGREIAERFVAHIDAGVSWKEGNYAHWVDPLERCPWATDRDAIAVGQIPDFTRWT